MTPDEIKERVSIEQVLEYYDRTPGSGKKWLGLVMWSERGTFEWRST
jgi:hypothetical protein